MTVAITTVSRSLRYLACLPFRACSSVIQMNTRNFTVIIEGNIGSGKTEMLNHIASSEEIKIVSEPLDRWQNVENSGINILAKFYSDPKRWCLPFQSYVQLTMLQTHQEAQMHPLAVMERSIFSARHCFVENLYRTKVMSEVEYHILDAWYRRMCTNIKVDLIIYLRCDPAICKERILARGRKEESGISLEYLQQLHDLHEEWLNVEKPKIPSGTKLVIIEAGRSMEEMQPEYEAEKKKLISKAKRQKI